MLRLNTLTTGPILMNFGKNIDGNMETVSGYKRGTGQVKPRAKVSVDTHG